MKPDSFRVIFEDDQLLVVDKDPGLVVDPSNTAQTGTLAQKLQSDYKINLDRGGIVHRLDKDTSGLLIVAKTEEALDNLQSQFQNRVVKKTYITLVHGFSEPKGSVEEGIMRNPQNREKFITHSAGKDAKTDFIQIQKLSLSTEKIAIIFADYSKIQLRKLDNQSYSNYSLLECFPHTGRTHQIRVHLKHIGHPVVGDQKYAGRKIARLDNRWCPRQFLHASKIEFKHPRSDQAVFFESPLPQDLQSALSYLVPTD